MGNSNIHEYEYNDDVIKYYDQPCKLCFNCLDGDVSQKIETTPDFFEISKSFVGLVECKLTSVLLKLIKDYPWRYYYDPVNQRFGSHPVENYLRQYGLSFRIITEKDLPSLYMENIGYVLGYKWNFDISFSKRTRESQQQAKKETAALVQKTEQQLMDDK